MSYTHWGQVFSRSPANKKNESSYKIHSFRTSQDDLTYNELPNSIRKNLEKKLKEAELKKRFIVEAIVLINPQKRSFKIEMIKKARISPERFPELIFELLEDDVIKEDEIFNELHLDYVKTWYSGTLEENVSSSKVLIRGDSISYGACTGYLAFNKSEIKLLVEEKKPIIWAVDSVSPDELNLIKEVDGIILTKAGASSHAAVIIKNLSKPFILSNNISKLNEKEKLTLDANTGLVYKGFYRIKYLNNSQHIKKLQQIAKEKSNISIAANANNGEEAARARRYEADGIALCRTEHMFIQTDKLNKIRKLFLEKEVNPRLISELKKIQTEDFHQILNNEIDQDVIIRMLDLPIYELMPEDEVSFKNLAKTMEIPLYSLKKMVNNYSEQNSMMGYRSARFLLKNRVILNLQIEAILKAAERILKEGKNVKVGFELPLVSTEEEIKLFKNIIKDKVKNLLPNYKNYQIGAMIETPRACLIADKIAKHVDFISFGTNDLTQFTYAFSRDDTSNFFEYYLKEKLIEFDPFQQIDEEGIGWLINHAINLARREKKNLNISICGEQAANPKSIKFLLKAGVNKIGCSVSRIPTALFASAKYSTQKEKKS